MTNPQIYTLINDVKKKVGPLAPKKTAGVPFPFRGIDGTVNHVASAVNEVGIVIVPRVLEHEVLPRELKDGRVVKTTKVTTEFVFYAPDGSSVSAITSGLADDFADRSTAQAQSVAFRVALLQTFLLPTQSSEPEETGQKVQDKPGQSKVTTGVAKARAPRAAGGHQVQAFAPRAAGLADSEKKAQQAVLKLIEDGKVSRDLASETKKKYAGDPAQIVKTLAELTADTKAK